MNQEVQKPQVEGSLDEGTYEIIRKRLNNHRSGLQQRLQKLNESRKTVFGALETELIANNRISTEHNCIARDIISLGNTCIFGYNVHFGLRTEIKLSDVFSVFTFEKNKFVAADLSILENDTFITDFSNLYKYYRNTIFVKFARIGNYLHMVFQLSERETDIKTFKWLIRDETLTYIDNRSEHEYSRPPQHQPRSGTHTGRGCEGPPGGETTGKGGAAGRLTGRRRCAAHRLLYLGGCQKLPGTA